MSFTATHRVNCDHARLGTVSDPFSLRKGDLVEVLGDDPSGFILCRAESGREAFLFPHVLTPTWISEGSPQPHPIPKIAILGYGRAGKDEGSEFLAKHTALRFPGSTSEIALPFVAERLGLPEDVAWAKRHEMREDWYRICNELRADDPLFLVRKVLAKGDIVCGLRDKKEVQLLPSLGVDLRIWVHRDVPVDHTTKFTKWDCDVVVLNTHPTDLTPYFDRLARLVRAMGVECSWGHGNAFRVEPY
jgi:hypothetical protein